MEHSYATYRLGFPVVFDKKHITMHYRLDCNNPEHRAIAQVGSLYRTALANPAENNRRLGARCET